MTFPQPNSNDPALTGGDYFRLNTELQSPGDIFESEQGALAFAIGPDSDLANVLIYYYDASERYFISGATGLPVLDTALVQSFTLSPDRSFVGRIAAFNTEKYPLSDRAGRILLAAGDIVDPTWKSVGGIAGDAFVYQPIIFDVIQYFTPTQSLVPQRSDKVYRYVYFDEGTDPLLNATYLVIPAYGRKSGYFTFINRGAAVHDISVIGVNLGTSGSSGPNGNMEQILFAAAAVAVGATVEYVFDSSVDGLFDLFAIRISLYDQAEAIPTVIRLSDDPL